LFSGGSLSPCADCKTTVLDLGELVYAVQIINGGSSCALQLQFWNITNITSTFPEPVSTGTAFCIQDAFTASSYSVAFSASQAQNFCTPGDLPGVVVFSNNVEIYASVLCANPVTGSIIANNGSAELVQVDVGSSLSVSLHDYNGQLMVLETHSNGFCWNSEPNNKQPTPATCSNTPFSIDYILNYNFGSFDDWTTHITNIINNKNTSYNLDSIFSSCHPTILHGAYDSGSSPQVALFSSYDDSGNEALLLAEVHVGLPEKYNSSSQCGFALHMDGIVLDSWLINQWYL